MTPIKPEDAEEIAELDMWLFAEECLNEATLRTEIEAGEGFVVRRNGKIVAYLLGRQTPHTFDVLRLGVHPQHQRRGYGSELLDAVLPNRPHSMLTVRKGNTAALKLYLKKGFHIAGELDGNAWVMTRD